jgi:hypothetical protein
MTSHLTLYPSALLIKLSQRRQALLVAMFVTLHVALMQDISSDIGRILMLPHFALFLLWQPFVSARSRISNTQILLTVAVFLMASLWMSWWLAGFWVILLAGMVGGRH